MRVSKKFIESKQFRDEIEKCRTPNQVRKLLERYEIPIKRDDSEEVGSFSIWINDAFRIYQTYRKDMVLQKWHEVDMTYSGAPMYPSARK